MESTPRRDAHLPRTTATERTRGGGLAVDAFASARRAHLPRAPSPSSRRGLVGPLPRFDAMWTRSLEVYAREGTLRALPVTAGMVGVFHAVRSLVRLGHVADDLLYPAWRDQPIEKPVFMFANARSGTTLLHRLMALDEERFAPTKLYETLFPSTSLVHGFRALAAIDEAHLGGILQSAVDLVDRTLLGGWQDIHPLGLGQNEEDEATFCLALHTPTMGLLLPEIDQLEDLFWFDELPDEDRHAFLDFYEGAIKRHLFASGPGKRLLNKNVFHTPRIRSLHERFPDAVFVYLVRAPHESIGSYLDMFHRAWAVHRPDIGKDSREARALAEMAIRQYRYALAMRKVIPASQFVVVTYDELTRDPARTVERLYDHLGMTPSAAFRIRLEEARARQRTFASEHRYRLEDFGITARWVADRLPEVYEEFGFPRP